MLRLLASSSSSFSSVVLTLIVLIICFLISSASGQVTNLPPDEVVALQQIGRGLGKTNWDFNVDPCNPQSSWTTQNQTSGSENYVNCTCLPNALNDTVCHVFAISLKSQSLRGTLPPELARLPSLQEIDLSRNYLNGTLPPEWGSMQLVKISLLGNRLTGPIPEEFGNISTLVQLSVEFNQLSGAIPPELGNLSRLERLHLTSNNFTGELPETLAKLAMLEDFRIGDNHFVGRIPNFIQNLTNLEKLVIQGSGLNGPIPPGIALLTNMSDLRISDLNGTESTFPPLSDMTNLATLILRSCNIIGQLPDYLGTISLSILDLSFNKLSGQIPGSFSGLSNADFIYLTGNLLSGPVPAWMLPGRRNIDLSFNNFTSGNSTSSSCQDQNVNLFGSSSTGNTTGIVSCLRSRHCTQNWTSLHINCGGGEVTVNGNTRYEDDGNSVGPSSSTFLSSRSNWGTSSTGNFLDDNIQPDTYTVRNNSRLSVNTSSELYMDARLSPLSLTYYGFCMRNGNYTVNLHFAEIMFTDDRTYSSLGRRIFDVYIQGVRMLKDFNIADEAGGVGRAIIRTFTAVVTSNTLEIRFYWAGKGTTGMPRRGVYGPLISAISVEPDFPLPSENGKRITTGAVVGIVVGVAFFIFLVVGILWWKGCRRRKDNMAQDLKGLDLHTGSYTLRQIKAATNNFDDANKIGEGGFGPVYQGLLLDGTIIAVKQLSSKSKQGNREFVNEIGMISALQHPHLVKLYGCCIEGNQLLLVYEYMENNSLARALFGPEECQLELDWPTRYKICIGIARGLAYLHEESRLKIVHRDIKATNVLLDKDLNPKISDFGLAKLDDEENTHISTRIAGTFGYMAPEYAMRGHLTDKADVYSFGIVALEIVSGRSNTSYKLKAESIYLLDWALVLKEKGSLMELVDPRLGPDFNQEEAMRMINLALQCTDSSAAVRPTMSSVVSMLEGRTKVEDIVSEPSRKSDKTTHKEMLNHQHGHTSSSTDSQVQSISVDGPWTASSTSTADLYPINLPSEYLDNRI